MVVAEFGVLHALFGATTYVSSELNAEAAVPSEFVQCEGVVRLPLFSAALRYHVSADAACVANRHVAASQLAVFVVFILEYILAWVCKQA